MKRQLSGGTRSGCRHCFIYTLQHWRITRKNFFVVALVCTRKKFFFFSSIDFLLRYSFSCCIIPDRVAFDPDLNQQKKTKIR
jgi:hypothetical protein